MRDACLSLPLRLRPASSSLALWPARRASAASVNAAPLWLGSYVTNSSTGSSADGACVAAMSIRSIPAAQPTPGVGGPPSCPARPS